MTTGKVYAQEYGPGIKGQMSFDDVEKNEIEIDGQIVDTENGRN